MNKLFTATVLGGTGLVGSFLVNQLLNNPKYGKVILLSRRPLKLSHPKLQVLLVDFEDLKSHELDIVGDVLFSCLGTTLSKAGSKENQYTVDYQYQYDIAKLAHQNGTQNYVLVSSAGANSESKVFYSRMKGELDEAVQKVGFENVAILRPSILAGPREETRVMERIGLFFMNVLKWIPGIKKYRPIHVRDVAKAMINAHLNSRAGVFELQEVHSLAKQSN